ncbi:chondroitin sulfate synthase 1 precursor [Triplophysa rosa]|uniref:Hexosyltransferase n=1 Tax=Triplophysa rosa TaxID=992332 RepID=A0A9W7X4Q1_TRIRA|nr:chondroitin sulfate synthase 1 precursor [Triplophysa rosa]
MLSRKIAELRHRTIQLHHEVLEWEFLTGKYIFSSSDGQPPRRGIDSSQKMALDDIIMQVMEMINANAKTRGRVIDFKEIQYGYRRVNPMYGAEYVLDLLLLYKKHKGKTMTVPVRRHAYLQQTFSKIQFREEEEMDARVLAARINQDSDSLSFLSNSLKMLVPFKLSGPGVEPHEPKEKKINILVPLAGRYEIFVRFMANFEKICLIPNQNVKLLILLFSTDNNTERVKQIELMREYHMKYPKADMEIKPVSGPFSRAMALEVGSAHFTNDSLLFYCDVDLLTDTGIVHVHHPVVCDPNLDPKQYKMCLGSKASSHGSTQQLAELWLEKNDQGFRRITNSNNGSTRTE